MNDKHSFAFRKSVRVKGPCFRVLYALVVCVDEAGRQPASPHASPYQWHSIADCLVVASLIRTTQQLQNDFRQEYPRDYQLRHQHCKEWSCPASIAERRETKDPGRLTQPFTRLTFYCVSETTTQFCIRDVHGCMQL